MSRRPTFDHWSLSVPGGVLALCVWVAVAAPAPCLGNGTPEPAAAAGDRPAAATQPPWDGVLESSVPGHFRKWESAYLMEEGAADAKVVATIQRGSRVVVLPERSNTEYYYVRLPAVGGDRTGFVWRDFVRPIGAVMRPSASPAVASPAPMVAASAKAVAASPSPASAQADLPPVRPPKSLRPFPPEDRQERAQARAGHDRASRPAKAPTELAELCGSPPAARPKPESAEPGDEEARAPAARPAPREDEGTASAEPQSKEERSTWSYTAQARKMSSTEEERVTPALSGVEISQDDPIEKARKKIDELKSRRHKIPAKGGQPEQPAREETSQGAQPAPSGSTAQASPEAAQPHAAGDAALAEKTASLAQEVKRLRRTRERIERQLEEMPRTTLSRAAAADVDRKVTELNAILEREKALEEKVAAQGRAIEELDRKTDKRISDLEARADGKPAAEGSSTSERPAQEAVEVEHRVSEKVTRLKEKTSEKMFEMEGRIFRRVTGLENRIEALEKRVSGSVEVAPPARAPARAPVRAAPRPATPATPVAHTTSARTDDPADDLASISDREASAAARGAAIIAKELARLRQKTKAKAPAVPAIEPQVGAAVVSGSETAPADTPVTGSEKASPADSSASGGKTSVDPEAEQAKDEIKGSVQDPYRAARKTMSTMEADRLMSARLN